MIPGVFRYPTPGTRHPIPDTRCPGLACDVQEVFVDVGLHVYTPEIVKVPSKGKGKTKGARGTGARGGGGDGDGSGSGAEPAYIFNRALPPVRWC